MRSPSWSRRWRARPTSSSAWCREAAPLHDAREYDAVVAAGEQVTAGLLAIVLQGMGINARSWQGWQLPILTDERAWLRPHPRDQRRRADQAFQGAQRGRRHRRVPGHAQGDRPHHHARPRRLGHLRGGNRGRDRCRPLRHLYRCRRRLHHRPAHGAERRSRMDKIAYEEMLEMASLGAKVHAGALGRAWHGAQGAHFRALELRRAGRHRSARHPPARSFATRKRSWNSRSSPASPSPRTRRRSRIRRVQDRPGVAAAIFGPLAEANINVDMIVQNVSADGATTDITFTVPVGRL